MTAPHTNTSPRARQAAAIFGLTLGASAPQLLIPSHTATLAAEIDGLLRPGESCLITGPSGAGKSTLLRHLAAALGPRAVLAHPLSANTTARVIDLLRSPLPRAISILAAAGLAEAGIFLQPASHLSEGQRARLSLAIAMERASCLQDAGHSRSHPITIIADEFASTLDRTTALCLARTASRWAAASSTPIRLVGAAAHDDLAPAMAPALLATLSLNAPPTLHRPAATPSAAGSFDARVHIRPGSPADYAAFARWHYRAGPPATFAHVLVATDAVTNEAIGVLVVSNPALNAPVRHLAWPRRFRTGSRRADAQRLNAELRTISRVVVDPRWRGVGIARRLVRAYLDAPLTPATEAVAAMGVCSPFFSAAGMRAYPLPLAPRHARLADALATVNIHPRDLADPEHALRLIHNSGDVRAPRLLRRELALWADASRATRRHAGADLPHLLHLAAASAITAPAIGYAHAA